MTKDITDQLPNAEHASFLEAARELGCDEDGAAFDEKLKEVAKAKPKAFTRGPTNE